MATNERMNIDVVLNDSRFQSGIRGMVTSLNRTARETEGVSAGANKMGLSFGSAIKTMGGIAIVETAIKGVGAAVSGAISVGMEYTKQMSKVEAITGSSSLQMAQLGANARKLGADTRWSATNVAEAYEYMALAGWDSNAMIEASLPLLNLATTGALDLARASDIVTDTMTPFGLAADQAGRVADVFATAQATANLNVEQLGETMKYAAPIAATFGASLEDTAVVAQIFANSGIKASMAGTALRAGLSRLAEPPKMAARALEDLGVSTTKTDGTMKSLRDIIGEMSPKFAELTDQQQIAAAKAIFGEEAYAGWIMVLKGGLPEFDRLHTLLDESEGSADAMAKVMSNNLSGAMDNASSAAENLGLILFSRLEKGLTASTNGSIGLMNSLTKMLDPYGKAVEATKLLQTEEQKLNQVEAILTDQKNKGKLSQEEYTRRMHDAKTAFEENTSYGKNLADALTQVEMRHASGITNQEQYTAEQKKTIETMKAQSTTSQELGVTMGALFQQYTNGTISANDFTNQIANGSIFMKQSAIDGGAFQQKIQDLNNSFIAGKLPQDQYNAAIKTAIQGFNDGNVAGEVFTQRMNELDQELAKGNINQDMYNTKKKEAITALQDNGTQAGILKQMYAQLDQQLAAGKITEEQYIQKKKEATVEANSLSMALEKEKGSQEKVNNIMQKFSDVMAAVWEFVKPLWDDMRKFIGECMEQINTFIAENGEEIRLFWDLLWTVISFIVDTVWRGIKRIVQGAMDVIMGIIKVVGGIMKGDWSKVWEGFKQILSGAVNIILGIFDVSFIKGLLTGLARFGLNFIRKGVEIFKGFVDDLAGNLAKGIQVAIKWGSDFIRTIVNALRDLPSAIKDAFVKGWNAIVDMDWEKLGKSIVNGIINGIKSMGSAIGSAASWIGDKLNPFSESRSVAPSGGGGGGEKRSLAAPKLMSRMPMSLGGDGLQAFAGGAQQVNALTQSGFSRSQSLMGTVQAITTKAVNSSMSNKSNTPSSGNSKTNMKPIEIVVKAPIIVDGRELARGTARVNSEEIKRSQTRTSRGTGGLI